MKKTNTKKYLLTLSSLALLPTLTFAGNYAYADSARYQTEVTPSLKLTIPTDSINITVDPSSKPFDSKDLNIIVATNNLTGYNLTMSSDSVNLIKTNDDSKTIPTLTANEGGYTSSTFEANKWGYKIGDGNYIPFVSGTIIGGSDTTTNNDTTTLNFAAKVDYVQPAGEYKTVLNFLAVANPLPVLYAQDLDFAHCPTTPLTVVDNRDNEEYIVQRLADGNCWMLDNLRLDPTQVPLETLQGNTNATDESLGYLKNGGGTKPYTANAVTVLETSQSSMWDPYIMTGNKDVVVENTPGNGSGKAGVYYNYCAISAGSYCYSDGNENQGDNVYDLCPAGWKLPTGSDHDDSDYKNLYNVLGQDKNTFVEKLSFPMAGMRGEFSSMTVYWTHTYSSNDNMYTLEFNVSEWNGNRNYNIWFQEDKFRNNIMLARCVMKKDLNSVEYLQDVTSSVLNNTAVDTIATLKDRRDEEEYVVGKLADGNLWMLDNLRLDLTAVSLDNLKSNTNATDESLTYLKNGGGTGQYAVNGVTSGHNLEQYTLQSPYINTEYIDTVPNYHYGAGSGTRGVFYNYCAVSAGSYCYDSSPSDTNASEDICPSGWRLPVSSSDENSELRQLRNAYTSQDAFNEAFSYIGSGGFFSNNPPTDLSSGYFWSSSREISESMYYNYGGMIRGGTSRARAFSARCIFNK